MIRIIYITAFLFCQLFASNHIEYRISFEYWLNENLKIFSIDDILILKFEDDRISINSNNWFGEIILNDKIEHKEEVLSSLLLFRHILSQRKILKEDIWINDFVLLDDKAIKVRYLFNKEDEGVRIYRMDVREINKDGDDNMINNVILNSDIITVWTDFDKEIQKIALMYNNASYVIKLDEK